MKNSLIPMFSIQGLIIFLSLLYFPIHGIAQCQLDRPSATLSIGNNDVCSNENVAVDNLSKGFGNSISQIIDNQIIAIWNLEFEIFL